MTINRVIQHLSLKGWFRIRESVIRRSLVVLTLVAPGYFLNLGLLVCASRILSASSFGVFYTAVSAVNILIAPSVVLGLFVVRQMTQDRVARGPAAVVADFSHLVHSVLKWGGAAGILVVSLAVIGLEFESFELLLLIVVCALMAYLAETIRTTFQGLQMFIWFGVVGLVWMTLRFALGLVGLWVTRLVWPGLLGMSLAALVVFFVFRPGIRAQAPIQASPVSTRPLRFNKMPLFMLSYGLFVGISYMDVMLAYFMLDRVALGSYSSLSVLPKAFLMVLMPVLQVFFPLITGEQSKDRLRVRTVVRGLMLTACLSIIMVLGLMLFRDFARVLVAGESGASSDILVVLALSVVPLALIRLAIIVHFALGRDRHPLLLAIPTVCFLAFWFVNGKPEVYDLAVSYLIFTMVLLFYYCALSIPGSVYRRLLKRDIAGGA